jgi:hypothetical protein
MLSAEISFMVINYCHVLSQSGNNCASIAAFPSFQKFIQSSSHQIAGLAYTLLKEACAEASCLRQGVQHGSDVGTGPEGFRIRTAHQDDSDICIGNSFRSIPCIIRCSRSVLEGSVQAVLVDGLGWRVLLWKRK